MILSLEMEETETVLSIISELDGPEPGDSRDFTVRRRFWTKVDTSSITCWEWQGGVAHNGYGRTHFRGRSQYTHRVAWQLVHGSIPDGMCICHHCDNPSCVRPSHLFLGTHAENTRDAVRKGRWARQTGENSHKAKLREKDVHEIRRLYATGEITLVVLSGMYRVAWQTVNKIVRRRSWKHI